MRILLVALFVSGCTCAPSTPSLALAAPSSVRARGAATIVVIASIDEQPGRGIVRVQSSGGSLVDGVDLILDATGQARVELVCADDCGSEIELRAQWQTTSRSRKLQVVSVDAGMEPGGEDGGGVADAGRWTRFTVSTVWPGAPEDWVHTSSLYRLDGGALFVEYWGLAADGGFLGMSTGSFHCKLGVFVIGGRSVFSSGRISHFFSCYEPQSFGTRVCSDLGSHLVIRRDHDENLAFIERAPGETDDVLSFDGDRTADVEVAEIDGEDRFACVTTRQVASDGGCWRRAGIALIGPARKAHFDLADGYCADLSGDVAVIGHDFSSDRNLPWRHSTGLEAIRFDLDGGFRREWSGNFDDCRVWRSSPLTLACVSSDQRRVVRVSSGLADVEGPSATTDAGWRLLKVVADADPIALFALRREVIPPADGLPNDVIERSDLYVQRLSWAAPRIVLDDVDTSSFHAGLWSSGVLRVAVSGSTRGETLVTDVSVPP